MEGEKKQKAEKSTLTEVEGCRPVHTHTYTCKHAQTHTLRARLTEVKGCKQTHTLIHKHKHTKGKLD